MFLESSTSVSALLPTALLPRQGMEILRKQFTEPTAQFMQSPSRLLRFTKIHLISFAIKKHPACVRQYLCAASPPNPLLPFSHAVSARTLRATSNQSATCTDRHDCHLGAAPQATGCIFGKVGQLKVDVDFFCLAIECLQSESPQTLGAIWRNNIQLAACVLLLNNTAIVTQFLDNFHNKNANSFN